MAKNKKHHYVPRFYLKRFSTNGYSVCLWNIKNELLIKSANLKNQCYKDYFYGEEPTVEKALGIIEGEVANILRSIDELEEPPIKQRKEYVTLMIYLMMQFGRTAYSADALDEVSDKLIKHLVDKSAKEKNLDLSQVRVKLKSPGTYSLALATHIYPLILDLECKLVINETDVEFITSDNPVVFYNQLLSFRNFGGDAGIAAKGLQVFYPISPNKMLLYYDKDSYSFGNKKNTAYRVFSRRDIYELNTLQMVSAYENVYFNNPDFNINALARKSNKFRRKQKSELRTYPGEDNKVKKEILTISRVDIRTNLKLSFIKITKRMKKWKETVGMQKIQPAVLIRNLELYNDFDEFRVKVKEGKFAAGEFGKFIKEKYRNVDI